jgi:hypothetical protein
MNLNNQIDKSLSDGSLELREKLNKIKDMKTDLKPSNFTNYPFSSVFEKSEHETVARNIMVILKRTGDVFRRLTWAEYKKERLKDGNFSDGELKFFSEVNKYCRSAKEAVKFSKEWHH